MGQCVGKITEKPHSFQGNPIQLKSLETLDQTTSPLINVETTKKVYAEDFKEEEKKQVDEVTKPDPKQIIYSIIMSKNLKRNEKRGNFKIKPGADKESEPIYEYIQKVEKEKTKEDLQLITESLKEDLLVL